MKGLVFALVALSVGTASAANLEVTLKVLASSTKDCATEPVGFLEQQKIRFVTETKNAQGTPKYTFFHSLQGLNVNPIDYGAMTRIVKEKTSWSFQETKLPALRPDVSRIEVVFGVMVQDSKGNQATALVKKAVTRRVYLQKNTDYSRSCYQVVAPEIVSGVYVNLNDTDTTLTTSEALQKIMEGRKTKTKGWAFSPSVFAGGVGVSLFSFDVHHMKSLAYQVAEGSSVNVTNTLNNGDAGFLYRQGTRFKQAFNVYSVNGCGQGTEQGLAWAEVEHNIMNFHKVDPAKSIEEVFRSRAFGSKIENTCSEIDQNSVTVFAGDEEVGAGGGR